MPSPVFDDTSLDDRTRPIVEARYPAAPAEETLRRATVLEYVPSPVMLDNAARWMGIREALAGAGLAPAEILRVFLRAQNRAYGLPGPGAALLAAAFADAPEPWGGAIAREVCEHLLTLQGAPPLLEPVGTIAMARIAAVGELDPRYEPLLSWSAPLVPVIRALLTALPLDRSEALVLSGTEPEPGRARSAANMLDRLLYVWDVVDTPAVAARRVALVGAAAGDYQHEALSAEAAGGVPRPVDSRPTPRARESLELLLNRRAAERRAAEIAPLAERCYAERTLGVDAAELISVAAWEAATEERRSEIAAAVATALGPAFSPVGLERFGGHPIAVLAGADGQRFCVVPGGSVEIGFSPEEEAAVRAAAELHAGCDNHYELYELLFEQLDHMRPLVRVEIGPMVVAQGPGETIKPAEATNALERSRLRLPSEAEWEYLARGGRSREPTYRGAGLPDSEAWFEATRDLGAGGANAFGLWGFGFEPEVCADVFHPSHTGLPVDGSPRCGEGPRVVRGGAAQLYPWQACGEWQLLLSAMRTSQTGWEYGHALRPVIGVQVARHR